MQSDGVEQEPATVAENEQEDPRIDEVAEDVDNLYGDFVAFKQRMKERFEDVQAENEALHERVDELETRLDQVANSIENAIGVEDDANSNPEKRAKDLRLALVREADAREDTFEGRSSKWWKEVQDLFLHANHGEIAKPDCYKAMRWAAGEEGPLPDVPGFSMGTKTNENGAEVKAVRLNLAELPADAPSRNPTTGEKGATGRETTTEANNHNKT